MPDAVVVRMPPAHPAVYLEWMAYWRDIEGHMVERPALEEFASNQSAPFLRDPIADWISDALVGGIIRQAGTARREGRHQVAPEIAGDALVFGQALRYVVARARWLGMPGIHEAIGIEPPSAEIVALREWTMNSVMVQLAIHAGAATQVEVP